MSELDVLQARIAADYAAILLRLVGGSPDGAVAGLAAKGTGDGLSPAIATGKHPAVPHDPALRARGLVETAQRVPSVDAWDTAERLPGLSYGRVGSSLGAMQAEPSDPAEPIRFRLKRLRHRASSPTQEAGAHVDAAPRITLGRADGGSSDYSPLHGPRPASSRKATINAAGGNQRGGLPPPAGARTVRSPGFRLGGSAKAASGPAHSLTLPWAEPDLLAPAAWAREEPPQPDPLADATLEDALAAILERAASEGGVDLWR